MRDLLQLLVSNDNYDHLSNLYCNLDKMIRALLGRNALN